MRADTHNEFVSDFLVYTGKDGNRAEVNLGGKVVTKLSTSLEKKGCHIIIL